MSIFNIKIYTIKKLGQDSPTPMKTRYRNLGSAEISCFSALFISTFSNSIQKTSLLPKWTGEGRVELKSLKLRRRVQMAEEISSGGGEGEEKRFKD